eukprot:c8045_g1_i1.p1 GENE.c8045_g1_i1~~c8045_g1_i1.p1  ORF type:complete len:382 (+),score=54.85 c8045_g1_i1:34-1146(+)
MGDEPDSAYVAKLQSLQETLRQRLLQVADPEEQKALIREYKQRFVRLTQDFEKGQGPSTFPESVVFGVPIERLHKGSDDLPIVLKSMFDAIFQERFLHSDGIFRVPGSTDGIQKIISEIEQVGALDASRIQSSQHNDLASVFKHFFRKLPHPVCPLSSFASIIELQKNSGTLSPPASSVHSVLISFPPDHLRVFTHTLQLLNRVSCYSDINGMTPPNLAVVFAPTLFRAPPQSRATEELTAMVHITLFLSNLISRFDYFFANLPQYRRSKVTPSPNHHNYHLLKRARRHNKTDPALQPVHKHSLTSLPSEILSDSSFVSVLLDDPQPPLMASSLQNDYFAKETQRVEEGMEVRTVHTKTNHVISNVREGV